MNREGHDFSRADRGQEKSRALAPEVLVYANSEDAVIREGRDFDSKPALSDPEETRGSRRAP